MLSSVPQHLLHTPPRRTHPLQIAEKVMVVYAPLPKRNKWDEGHLINWFFTWNYRCIARNAKQAMDAAIKYNQEHSSESIVKSWLGSEPLIIERAP